MSPIEPRDEAVFEAARQLPAAQRGAYLDQTCEGDPALRGEADSSREPRPARAGRAGPN